MEKGTIREMNPDEVGKLDYLVIMKEYRGRGFGKRLMDWAIRMFAEHEIQQIEVKVVDGNETIHLYEKYGFKMNAHILMYDKRKNTGDEAK